MSVMTSKRLRVRASTPLNSYPQDDRTKLPSAAMRTNGRGGHQPHIGRTDEVAISRRSDHLS